MSKKKEARKFFILDAKKGKYEVGAFHAIIKYQFDEQDRRYILDRLGQKYYDITYNTPKPKSHIEIRKNPAYLDEQTAFDLMKEILFYIEALKRHSGDINGYILVNDLFERALLLGDYDLCLDLLDEMDNNFGHSLYSLLAEYYINEITGDREANHALLKNLNDNKADIKVLIIMNLTRQRIDSVVSSLSYEGGIAQHKKLYQGDTAAKYYNYLDFRFDPLYFNKLSDYDFILNFDSDFSIIDRYQSLKKLLPRILSDDAVSKEDKDKIIEACYGLSLDIKDTYWINFNTVYAGSTGPFNDRSSFHKVQDLLFTANYSAVVAECFINLQQNPHHSELYVPFVQSLIQLKHSLDAYFAFDHPLYGLLEPMMAVLEKRVSYSADREKLQKKFYMISHFDFSYHILEFVTNELNIIVEKPVQLISFMFSSILRYNAFKLFESQPRLLEILKANPYKTERFLESLILNENSITPVESYLALKVDIGYLIQKGKCDEAFEKLDSIYKDEIAFNSLAVFMQTWIRRNLIRCLNRLQRLGDAADIVADSFFEKNFAYEHYVDVKLFEQLSDPFEDRFSSHITIPITFEIYRLPSTSIYDVIANFLIAQDVRVPSDLFERSHHWSSNVFHYFLERCCVKENLEDSPFLGSISALDDERIKILNYLKKINPLKEKNYNREIREITQETTLRKGLMQIHESRIYIDDQSIFKVHNIKPKELFDTYMSLKNVKMPSGSIMFFDSTFSEPNQGQYAYYFKQPVSEEELVEYDYENDYVNDDNVVEVSDLRYQYYVAFFRHLRNLFVYDEDYGFKSFLSMRIRHGTFSNVLRTVFEKYNLISLKDSNLDQYQDIKIWTELISSPEKSGELQLLLKEFSLQIDFNIDRGLSWLVIKKEGEGLNDGFFDFEFSDEELYALYRNRLGRIEDFKLFEEEIFKVFFERLDKNLIQLRYELASTLTSSFVSLLDELQSRISLIKLKQGENTALVKNVVNCRTEIQSITAQISNWFRISKNKYIEEFPIELILDTIHNYINTIYANALDLAVVTRHIDSQRHIKGRYFEAFGDLFINIFDNIVGKNKELKENLKIELNIVESDEQLKLSVANNVADGTNIDDLLKEINKAKEKIKNYQNGSDISYEKGSGYLKLCKSIAVDLQRASYSIEPEYKDGLFIVSVTFETKDLFA